MSKTVPFLILDRLYRTVFDFRQKCLKLYRTVDASLWIHMHIHRHLDRDTDTYTDTETDTYRLTDFYRDT